MLGNGVMVEVSLHSVQSLLTQLPNITTKVAAVAAREDVKITVAVIPAKNAAKVCCLYTD